MIVFKQVSYEHSAHLPMVRQAECPTPELTPLAELLLQCETEFSNKQSYVLIGSQRHGVRPTYDLLLVVSAY